MKRWIVAIVIIAMLGGVAWALWPTPSSHNAGPSVVPIATEPITRGGLRAGEADVPAKVTVKRRVDAAERERYLRYISRRIDEHQAKGGAPPAANNAPPDRTPAANDDGHGGKSDTVRLAEPDEALESLLGALQEDFMPLADECYAAALERDPTREGMLDVNFVVIADEDIGGLVESFEVNAENELQDAELIECVRETTLSTLFPAPAGTDRKGVRLTLKLQPDD